jgi:type IX secretion system PorP/SprF family membrane protein
MKNKLKYILFIAIACQFKIVSAQDIHFSQYYYSPISLNPALTAVNKNIQATFQFKQQWGVVKGYSTEGASFEFKFNQEKWKKRENLTNIYKKKEMKGLAVGVSAFADNAGNSSIKQTIVNVSLAYHVLLSRTSTLSAGLLGGYNQLSINPEQLRWNNQYILGNYSAVTPSGEVFANHSVAYTDFGAGILYSYGDLDSYISSNDQKHFDLGFSVSHVNQPIISFYDSSDGKLFRKYTFHASSMTGIQNSNFVVGGNFLYMYQNKMQEITPGVLVKYRFNEGSNYTGYKKGASFTVGCYYRAKDSFIPYVMVEMDKYSLGMSYDVNTSELTKTTSGRGGFEISLRFNTRSAYVYQNNK